MVDKKEIKNYLDDMTEVCDKFWLAHKGKEISNKTLAELEVTVSEFLEHFLPVGVSIGVGAYIREGDRVLHIAYTPFCDASQKVIKEILDACEEVWKNPKVVFKDVADFMKMVSM